MLSQQVPGWVLITVALGSNPSDTGPGDDGRFRADYRQLVDQGLGVIVRLNHGYAPYGTIPYEHQYDDFARRCANFVRISRGCHIWVIGNEPNHPIEWPGADWDWTAVPPRPKSPAKVGQAITPARYASCYRKVRAAIHAVPGHEADQVLVAAVAPWNNLTTYEGNPDGDWVRYFADVLNLLGPDDCDGIALHTYTHGSDPAFIHSPAKVGDARYSQRHWHFRAFEDFMGAIPAHMRHLPVYITETDQGDDPWRDENSGWVREAYRAINDWNRAEKQKIRALLLYRWPRVPGDRWYIEGKEGVIEDFRQALTSRFRWIATAPEEVLVKLAQDLARLQDQVEELQPSLQQLAEQDRSLSGLEQTATDLATQADQLTTVQQQLAELEGQVSQLEAELPAEDTIARPPLEDVRNALPRHPLRTYPTRSVSDIRRVIVHHTATRADITPQLIAQFQVNQGLPGIKYHYVISANGTIYWTQPLEAVVAQTAVDEVNADGVAVTFIGSFTHTVPTDAQMSSAARLIAWLLYSLNLDLGAVFGRSELDDSDVSKSPGQQWLDGQRYKETLLAQVQAILEAAGVADPAEVRRLRQRVRELEAKVAELEPLAAQVQPLQQRVQELEGTVAQQKADLDRLAAENSQLLAENARLWTIVRNLQGGAVERPPVVDVVDSLPKHPTLRYEKRTEPITKIVVHHTDTPRYFTVEQIAQYHVWGVRRDARGNLVKGEWPGIGYHYVIAPDGTIYWTNRHETRSYHVGHANNYSLGISLIGRFLKRNHNGQPIPADEQLPTAEQMRSISQLIAWLMQELKITSIEHVVGHKELSDTTCPGDQWLKGVRWKDTLHKQVRQVARGWDKPVDHMLLFWDHGTLWAETDFRNAQDYIAHFRPTITFSPADAMVAKHVTIVGGEAGVSWADENDIRNSGSEVHRLAGANEAETKAMLDDLVQKNTPYPGAPTPETEGEGGPEEEGGPAPAPGSAVDEWTVPDDWAATRRVAAQPPAPAPRRVKVDPTVIPTPEGAES